MSVTIFIPPFLRSYVSNGRLTDVSGNTVGECINNLIQQFPETRKLLLSDKGKLLDNVGIYINKEMISPDELVAQVKDGDEIYIISTVMGG